MTGAVTQSRVRHLVAVCKTHGSHTKLAVEEYCRLYVLAGNTRELPKAPAPRQPPEKEDRREKKGERPFALLAWAPLCSHPRPAAYGRSVHEPLAAAWCGCPSTEGRVLQTCRDVHGVQLLHVKTQGHIRTMTMRQKITRAIHTVPILVMTKC